MRAARKLRKCQRVKKLYRDEEFYTQNKNPTAVIVLV